MPYIGLDTFDTYGGSSKGKRVLVDELTLDDLEWVNGKCEYGDRYLRGWKSQQIKQSITRHKGVILILYNILNQIGDLICKQQQSKITIQTLVEKR